MVMNQVLPTTMRIPHIMCHFFNKEKLMAIVRIKWRIMWFWKFFFFKGEVSLMSNLKSTIKNIVSSYVKSILITNQVSEKNFVKMNLVCT